MYEQSPGYLINILFTAATGCQGSIKYIVSAKNVSIRVPAQLTITLISMEADSVFCKFVDDHFAHRFQGGFFASP